MRELHIPGLTHPTWGKNRVNPVSRAIGQVSRTIAENPRQAIATGAVAVAFVGIAAIDHFGPRYTPSDGASTDNRPAIRQTYVAESASRLMAIPQYQEWRNQLPSNYSVSISSYDPYLSVWQAHNPDQSEPRGVRTYEGVKPADRAFFIQEGRHGFISGIITIKDEQGNVKYRLLVVTKMESPKNFKAPPGSATEIIDLPMPLLVDGNVLSMQGYVDEQLNPVASVSEKQFAAPDVDWPSTNPRISSPVLST